VNLHLNKFKKRQLINFFYFSLFIFILSLIIPAFRSPVLFILRFPLKILTFLGHEANGIIFYHLNMVQKEKLTKEVEFLKQKLVNLEEVSSENERLKKLLSLKEETSYKVIAAKVIGRSVDSWSSQIIIDKGSSQGIKEGLVVISYAGLVGRIKEVSLSTAKVMLLNDLNMAVAAMVQRSRQEGLVSGTLSPNLIMRYLPKDSDVKISDTVITSGLTPLYPKGLLIGTVVQIGEEFSGLSRYCIIKPAVNLSSIEEVLIIIS